MRQPEYTDNIEQFLCKKATMNLVPISATLELTPLCNMNCDMCFVRLTPEQMGQQGTLLSIGEWLELAESMQKAGTLFVTITGGEPLLYPGFRELYLRLKQLGMYLTINTNGTLLDEEWADFFAHNLPRRINITIYGKDNAAYKKLCHFPEGYDRAVNAIRLLRERKVDVKINGTLTPANIEDADEIIALANQMQVPWKIDTYMYPASRERCKPFDQQARLLPAQAAEQRVRFMRTSMGDERFRALAESFRQKVSVAASQPPDEPVVSCRAGRSSFAISWRGMMQPCVLLACPAVSVREKGFRQAWDDLVQEMSEIRMSSRCAACAYRDVCNTCAACVFAECGSFDGVPEYMCQYTKETLRLMDEGEPSKAVEEGGDR